MTATDYLALTPEQMEERFSTYSVDGRQVQAEKPLVAGVETGAVEAWLSRNVEAAIEANDDGQERDAGGLLLDRWTWVYRIVHKTGSITILEAPGT